ncbi:XrtA system polysaccharide deacetylase [Aquisalimonas asiatica]|uniref:Polysaccharide deacetylase family protein, PEP-CTERM locus subfamily n=1 Tax=Aquisalimonas asiatica TaxID=406100 RepID=A0A1H8U4H3_9GAMM|nr:polysaccharide deacetylase family protein, PEP-CTERM locus subfamily [Aquisalimonas asiatica]
MSAPVANAMTFDVEDYFQVSAMEPHVPRDQWERMPCRVEANTDRLLALLDGAGVKATFFTLGWVAERCPALIRRIVAGGHELASHGYWHHRVTELDDAAFRDDILRAKGVLEDTGGVAVDGYRAPSFSIGADNLHVLRILRETGHRYSSSVYPVQHDHYGMPEAPREPFQPLGNDGVTELPLTTVRLAGRNLPAAGGGYFRLLPYSVFRRALQRVNRQEGAAGIFYLHPWEIDPGQPRIPGVSARTRFRHYVNLARTEHRLQRLLTDFAWAPLRTVYADVLDHSLDVPPAQVAARGMETDRVIAQP